MSLSNFYNLDSNSLEEIEYPEEYQESLRLDFSYIDNSLIPDRAAKIQREFEYLISNTTLGPFDYPDKDLKAFLSSVAEFRINYALRTYIPFIHDNSFECFHWVRWV
jgi:hypothetical protein